MTAELFARNLTTFNIALEEDATEYISSMLDDLSLSDSEDIQESTESFLIDANVSQETRTDFYKALFVKKSGAKEKQDTFLQPVKLKEVLAATQTASPIRVPQTIEKPKKTTEKKRRQEKEPEIIAVTQQSRFHTETLENLNKELDLQGVNITVNQNDLLVDAHLKLKPCTRYGLVGQNGVGKSILLKCLAENIMVGLPQSLHILHISQLEEFEEGKTVRQELLDSDRKVASVLRDYNVLHNVIGDTKELNKAVFSILRSRLSDKVKQAEKIAIKRSGLRGREARKELIACEKELADFEKVGTEDVNATISEIYEQFGMIDQDEREQRADRLLEGLGFSKDQKPISHLSGGWRMRLALAKCLFLSPDILLLDEPTNHLDLPAILWLQEYLINQTEDMVVVVVSHDREFLSNVTDETIIFKEKSLAYHMGNYEDWEKNRQEQMIRKQTLLENNEKRKKAIQTSIQKNAQQAKATGDDKRHGMINSRRKKLERLGMEKTEDGKRFKVSYRAGYHLNIREDIVVEKETKTAGIKIPQPTPLRYHGPMLSLKSVRFRYEGQEKDALKNFSINIEPKSRIAFMGPNGSGKTTLLNLLSGKKQPTSGEVYQHNLLRVGYFSQNIVDQLDLDATPIEHMMRQTNITEQECRTFFGSVGISGNLVLQSIRSLSGGQRSRIAFAMVLYDEPHVLVLDEITNHLDMGTVEMLVESLDGYTGAVVVVSHDVWFLKQMFKDQEGQIYSVNQGKVELWDKSIDAYAASVLRKIKQIKKSIE